MIQKTDLIPFIDLTSLSGSETTEIIQAISQTAVTPYGNVAAVCVFPEFVPTVRSCLAGTSIKIATVINFPDPILSLQGLEKALEALLMEGDVDEVDLLIDYKAALMGNKAKIKQQIQLARRLCHGLSLKTILETGILAKPALIDYCARLALDEGADFLKTSTGKAAVHATPEAFQILLDAVLDAHPHAGVKVSGGIHTLDDIQPYVDILLETAGTAFLDPQHFRIGSSRLLKNI